MKVLFDTETKVTTYFEAGGATVVHPTEETVLVKADGTPINPATGQPFTVVPGYVSETASMIAGLLSANAGKENPTYSTGPASTPQRVPFLPNKNYGDWTLDAGQKHQFSRNGATGSIAVHYIVPADAKVGEAISIKLAPVKGGDVTGEAAAGYGEYSAAGQQPMMNGQLTSWGIAVKVGDVINGQKVEAGKYVNAHLNIMGGEDEFFLESRIYRK